MTGGTVLILGDVGPNFAAGMSGGQAFVFDAQDRFDAMVNKDSVDVVRVKGDADLLRTLKGLLEEHVALTASRHGAELLKNWTPLKQGLLAGRPETRRLRLRRGDS